MPDPATIALGVSALASLAQGLTSRKAKTRQQPRFSPAQQARAEWAGNRAQSIYDNPTQGFDAIAKHSANQFNNTIVPNLASRFTTQTNGRLSSPSFGKELGMEGQDWKDQLNAMAAQYGLAQQGQANQLLAQAQQPQFENVYEAAGQTGLSNAFGGIGQAANQYGQFQQWNQMFNPNNRAQQQPQAQQSAGQDVQSLMRPLTSPLSQFSQQGTQGLVSPFANLGQQQAPQNNVQGINALNQQIPGSYGMLPANYQIPFGGQGLGAQRRTNLIANQARQSLGY